MALGEILGGGLDILGGNKASGIERRATRKAGNYLDQGYQQGIDLAKPMQETAAGDFQRQSDRYNAGEFSNPDQQKYQAGEFNYDPNAVFNDPEYKAQLRSGQQAIEGGAASHGGLFSGRTQQDLTKYGSDLFANRSDELYKRNRGAYENDRNFDYGATNRAYDTNADNRKTDFSEGNILADYAPEQTKGLIDLGLGRAEGKANTELGVGGIRAGNIRSAYQNAGNIAQDAANSYGPSLGKGLKKAVNYLSPEKGLY